MNEWYLRLPLTEKPNPSILNEEIRKRSCIGKKHWCASLDRIPDRLPYKKTIKRYIRRLHLYERCGYGLILYGELGNGKTSLASIILRNALAREGRVLSIRATKLMDALLSKYPPRLPSGVTVCEAAERVNFLLIDDMAHDDADWRGRVLEDIVRSRYDEKLPTLITVNDKNVVYELKWLKSLAFEAFEGIGVDGVNWRRKPPPDDRT